MARVEPTAEQLRAAFAVVRLQHWPADFDEAMADAVRCHLVRAAAVRQALGLPLRAPVLIHSRQPVQRPEPPPPRSNSVPIPARSLSTPFDRKRLAAGERDDD